LEEPLTTARAVIDLTDGEGPVRARTDQCTIASLADVHQSKRWISLALGTNRPSFRFAR